MLTLWQRDYYYYFNSRLLYRDPMRRTADLLVIPWFTVIFNVLGIKKRILVMLLSSPCECQYYPLALTSLSWHHRLNSWFLLCSGTGCHLQDTDYMKKIILAMFFFSYGVVNISTKYVTVTSRNIIATNYLYDQLYRASMISPPFFFCLSYLISCKNNNNNMIKLLPYTDHCFWEIRCEGRLTIYSLGSYLFRVL